MSAGLSVPACFALLNDEKSAPWHNHTVRHPRRPASVSKFLCLCLASLKDWLQSDGQPENKASFYFEEHMLLTEAQTL